MRRRSLAILPALVLGLTAPGCKRAPDAPPQHQGGGEGGGGGKGNGGGGGRGGGGKNKDKDKATGTATTATSTQAATDAFRVGGEGGVRGLRTGGGTGLGTGGGMTAQQEGDTQEHGSKRQRPPAVYVDGQALAAIAYGELPPALEATWVEFESGNRVRRFSVGKYLEALGVPLAELKAVHFHSGRHRVGIIDGDALRKNPDAAMFSFTQDTTGKARMHFAADSGVTTAIDRLWTLMVYRTKTPPTVNVATQLLELDGKPVTALPYVEQELGGGARVYLDGRLVGHVKRSTLDAKTSSASAPVELSLADALAKNGVDAKGVKKIVLVGEDKIVGEVAPARLAKTRLRLEQQSGGYLKIDDKAEANVILLYAAATPPRGDRAASTPQTPKR
jgi:hypothetical protein